MKARLVKPRARAEQLLEGARWRIDRKPPDFQRAEMFALAATGYALLAVCDELQAVTKALYDGRV